jgi:hypothetical protein
MVLWNVGKLLPDYTVLQPRREPSSNLILFSGLSVGLLVRLFNEVSYPKFIYSPLRSTCSHAEISLPNNKNSKVISLDMRREALLPLSKYFVKKINGGYTKWYRYTVVCINLHFVFDYLVYIVRCDVVVWETSVKTRSVQYRGLAGYDTVYFCRWLPIFRRKISPPC